MSTGVEFDGDNRAKMLQQMQSFAPGGQAQGSSKMAQWIINKGLAKDDAGAQKVLIVVVVINILIMIFVITYIL